jgi:hypothetical protein
VTAPGESFLSMKWCLVMSWDRANLLWIIYELVVSPSWLLSTCVFFSVFCASRMASSILYA